MQAARSFAHIEKLDDSRTVGIIETTWAQAVREFQSSVRVGRSRGECPYGWRCQRDPSRSAIAICTIAITVPNV
jgi:hypothetical protein